MTTANSFTLKLLGGFLATAMLFSLSFAPAQAQTAEELQEQINTLLATIAALQAQLGGGGGSVSGVCPFTWTRNLNTGASGADVMKLQQFLNSDPETRVAASGVGSAGSETQYYGPLTGAAVAKFQTKYRAEVLTPLGLVNPTTFFGPSTRAQANALCVTGGTPTDGGDGDGDGSTGDLEGGAGNIEDADYISGLNNEEVGEGADDVDVAGLEIEADGSDIEITAVNLNFSQGTAGSDFEKYADEVVVMLDGEEFARIDADEFTDDDNFDKNVSLDSGAIIRDGEVGDLVVAVSGISNMDSADEGDTWTLEFESVRFRDAQGAVISDTSTGDINDGTGRTFSFESFATASDVELKITSGDDDINDARAIDVDDTNDTDNVEIFSFNMEAEGNSDVTIDDMPMLYTTDGTPDVDEIINSAELWIDGEQVDSLSIPTSATTTSLLTFADFDYTLGAGETVDVVVRVDINDLEGDFDAGSTLSVAFGESETDNSGFDAEDEQGNDLVDGDKSGSASSDAHAFFDEGINVALVSTNTDVQADGAGGDDDDAGVFTMVFDVTAFGDTVYVDETPVATTDTTPVDATTSTSFFYVVYDSGTATTADLSHDVKYTTPNGVTDSGDNIEIQQDKTTRVTLTVTRQNSGDADDNGLYFMELVGVSFSAADDTTYEFMYTFDLDEFETATINLN